MSISWRKIRSSRGLRVALAAGVLLACATAIIIMFKAPAGGKIWKTSFATSQFRYFLTLCGVFVVLLAIGLGVLFRRRRKPMAGDAGAVILEFTMIFPIILMIVLLLYQSALLVTGHLFVTYSAFCAARSAIVYVPADIGDGRNIVRSYTDPEDSPKIWHIKRAATWALMPIGDGSYYDDADDADYLSEGMSSLMQNYDIDQPNWIDDYLGKKLAYVEDHTSIELAPPADESEVYGAHEDIRLKVKHDMYMAVPYAAGVFSVLDDSVVELDDGKFAMRVVIECTMPNQGIDDRIIPETFPKDD